MYKQNKITKTTIKTNDSYEGESIEEKVNRIVNNKEPIKDGAPLIYTERKDGVQAAYDIRTDRFEIAAEAMDKIAVQHLTKRKGKIKGIDENEQQEIKEKNEQQKPKEGPQNPAA